MASTVTLSGGTLGNTILTLHTDVEVQEERMTNGGFETGDWTGWTYSANTSISSSDPKSGTYCAHIEDSGDYITQILSTSTLRSLVYSFGFYAKSAYNNFDVILNFNDLTSKTLTGVPSGGSEEIYYYYNILTMDADGGGLLFPSGKTLVSLTIRQYSDNILSVDGVSLLLALTGIGDLRAIDFTNEQEVTPAISDFLNSEPDIQTDIWSKKKEIVDYTIRQTDAELAALFTCLEDHGIVLLNDSTYSYTDEQVIIIKVEAAYDAQTSWAHPWLITLELKRTLHTGAP
jgi:hypothetical protein